MGKLKRVVYPHYKANVIHFKIVAAANKDHVGNLHGHSFMSNNTSNIGPFLSLGSM